jgi:murein DD-endopeptidase MepM/ murein hydrolase activator NlpD
MKASLTLALCALAVLPFPAAAADPAVRVSTLPEKVLLERAGFDQRLNFDLVLRNDTPEAVEVSAVEARAYARDGSLVSERRVTTNGGSVETLNSRRAEPGGTIVVFNPFHTFAPDLELAELRYEIALDAGGAPAKYRAEIAVRPEPYTTKTDLVLPVAGRLLCYDGPDLYGHHRRLDVTGGMTTALGITSNFMRYAYDLCVVDAKGKMYRGTGERNEDWYGFGAPVLAPGAGTVVAAAGDVRDNTLSERVPMTREEVMKNPRRLFGNYVTIDHGNGEVSFLAHLKHGSVRVAPGQKVRQGEQVGEMGFSGDAMNVHLHYQLQRDAAFGEGLPAHFRAFRRHAGAGTVPGRGYVDSGDVVESTAVRRER